MEFRRSLILSVLFSSTVFAQTVYNPQWVAWDKETDPPETSPITHYYLQVTDDTGRVWPELLAPVSARVEETPTTWKIPFYTFPGFPVGRNYSVRFRACNVIGCSDVSAPAPGTFRTSACVRTVGVLPSMAYLSVTPPLKRGTISVVEFQTTNLPGRARQLRVALVGSGQPAWYIPLQGEGTTLRAQIGPPTRTGTFTLDAWVVDDQGCDVTLPTGTRLTVLP